MGRVAWFHCFAGIAGDMALGSLVDAGADLARVVDLVRALKIPDWDVVATTTQRCGVRATHLDVRAYEDPEPHRHYGEIRDLIDVAGLPSRVRDRAQKVFAVLAAAEADIHGVSVDDVHFHEVGGVDAIVDIVGTCAALELLGIDEVRASAVAQGTGTIRAAHGLLPNPAPATVALLASRKVPVVGRDVALELTTPTGAALLAGLATGFGPMPAMTTETVGYGAGTRDIDGLPNVTQVVIGTAVDHQPSGQPMVVLEANLDDVTGEVLAHSLSALLDAGAADAWLTPVLMKKGRPAHVLAAIAEPDRAEQLIMVIARETGSLGVRVTDVSRWTGRRRIENVELDGEAVRMKVGPHHAKPEFDDAVKVARHGDTDLLGTLERAKAKWRESHLDDGTLA